MIRFSCCIPSFRSELYLFLNHVTSSVIQLVPPHEDLAQLISYLKCGVWDITKYVNLKVTCKEGEIYGRWSLRDGDRRQQIGKNGRYPLHKRLGGPQDRTRRLRKISHSPGLDPRTAQSVASRYTNYAISTTPAMKLTNFTCVTRCIFVFRTILAPKNEDFPYQI